MADIPIEEEDQPTRQTSCPFMVATDDEDVTPRPAVAPAGASVVQLKSRNVPEALEEDSPASATALDDSKRPSDTVFNEEDGSDRRSDEERDVEWRLRQKHIFILNTSGRPIFTRYGDEGDFVDLFGIFRVLISMAGSTVLSNGGGADTLRRITAGPNHTMHFHTNGELIYVMVTRTGESAKACIRQLKMVHNQLLSVLPTANAILRRNASYDIRKMISSADVKVMNMLIKCMSNEPSFYFRSLQAVALPQRYRSEVDSLLRASHCGEDHLFSFLFHRKRVVSVISPPKMPIHPDDALLLMNFTACLAKSQSGVQWATVCLPIFNDTGYLWCYCQNVSLAVREHLQATDRKFQMDPADLEAHKGEHGLLLVHLSTSQELFPQLMLAGQGVIERLAQNNTYIEIETISNKATLVPYDSPLSSEDPLASSMALWFFLVTESGQLISSTQAPQFAYSKSARKHALRQLVKMKDKLSQVTMAPTPFLIVTLEDYSFLVLRQRGIGDVYAVFVPSVPKAEMMRWAVRWAKWAKSREGTYTITSVSVW